jgi:hypothetical protein
MSFHSRQAADGRITLGYDHGNEPEPEGDPRLDDEPEEEAPSFHGLLARRELEVAERKPPKSWDAW